MVLEEESENLLVPTVSLGSSGLGLSGVWCGWRPPIYGRIMLALLVGDDDVMKVLIGLRERRKNFLCQRSSFR